MDTETTEIIEELSQLEKTLGEFNISTKLPEYKHNEISLCIGVIKRRRSKILAMRNKEANTQPKTAA